MNEKEGKVAHRERYTLQWHRIHTTRCRSCGEPSRKQANSGIGGCANVEKGETKKDARARDARGLLRVQITRLQ